MFLNHIEKVPQILIGKIVKDPENLSWLEASIIVKFYEDLSQLTHCNNLCAGAVHLQI